MKQQMVEERGETLVCVPCWWDGSPESLVASIRLRRPDLLKHFPINNNITPIDPIPPDKYFTVSKVPIIGEPMIATFGISSSFSPENWWMSEKYDGVRAVWVPPLSELYSRKGVNIFVPLGIINHFSSVFLDGEIWFGRGSFHESQKVLRHNQFIEWEYWRYVCFDCPDPGKEKLPIEERLHGVINSQNLIISLGTSVTCKNREHVIESANQIIAEFGEGLILRIPKSGYDHGKSDNLFKFKAMREDQEGLVISTDEDDYCLQTVDGDHLYTKSISSDIPILPKRGDIVTFSFSAYGPTSGIPSSPKIEKIRTDVTWRDVIHNRNLPLPNPVSDITQRALFGITADRHPAGHWTEEEGINVKRFFDKFAYKFNFEPSLPNNWYSITSDVILREKDGSSVLQLFNGSVVRALVHAYPNLNFDELKFTKVRQNYWSRENKRKFLNNFAKKRNFDPLTPNNWYFITKLEILQEKGGLSVLHSYKNSVSKALLDLYPDIGLEVDHFYNYTAASKSYFLKLASDNNFDPLLPENWKHFSPSFILDHKGAAILNSFGGSLYSALKAAFPNLTMEESSLNLGDMYKRSRTHFKKVATKFNFDPLVGSNWYSTPPTDITSDAEGEEIIDHFSGSLFKALSYAFPELELEESKFEPKKGKVWQTVESRKSFFDSIASKMGFDPRIVDNWYPLSTHHFTSEKGGRSILSHYEGSLVKALKDIYPTLHFDDSQFNVMKKHYWEDRNNRRQFFDSFAKKRNFDPLIPDNWYNLYNDDINSEKGGTSILNLFDCSLYDALQDSYPQLKLEKPKFTKKILHVNNAENYWSHNNNRKLFFDEFAKQRDFDATTPENWYKVSLESTLAETGGSSVLGYHNQSLYYALSDAYPDLTFEPNSFTRQKKNPWVVKENRKKFLDEIAKQRNFDPLISRFWLEVPAPYILSRKGGSSLLYYYGSLKAAVKDIYNI